MRRLSGGFLFFSGMTGLVLVLVSWLPTSMNLGIVVFVCLLCLVCVWSGGRLLQHPVVQGKAMSDGFAAKPSGQEWLMAVCPRCGWQIGPRQRFCGGCGMAVESVCPQCGAVVVLSSRFCTNCGNKLVESEQS